MIIQVISLMVIFVFNYFLHHLMCYDFYKYMSRNGNTNCEAFEYYVNFICFGSSFRENFLV